MFSSRLVARRPRAALCGALALLAFCAKLAAPESAARNPLSRGLPEWLDLRAEWRLRAETHREEILSSEPDDDFGASRCASASATPQPHDCGSMGKARIPGSADARPVASGPPPQTPWICAKPGPRLRLAAHSFWLASRRDALYNPDGTVAAAAPPGGAASARAGEEVDFTVLWAPASFWEIDAGAMQFFSGPFVREARGAPVPGVLLYLAMTLRL